MEPLCSLPHNLWKPLENLQTVILAKYFLICQGLKDVTVENKEGGRGKGSKIPKLQFSQREKRERVTRNLTWVGKNSSRIVS